MSYEMIYSRITVKPKKEPIFSEMATHVELEDDAAGCFVQLRQETDAGTMVIKIDTQEWATIKLAIEELIDECDDQNGRGEDSL